jgi:iron(III) transport system permease protein
MNSGALQLRRPAAWVWAPAIGVGLLSILPLLGLWFTYLAPPGLVVPPPLSMDRVWPLLARTLMLATAVSTLSLFAGSWLAWVEVRTEFFGRSLLSALSLLPLAVPSYLLATIVREQMAPASALGGFFGLEGQFTGFWPATCVLSIACTPYVHLLVAATLRRCPNAEAEAASSLGATPWRVFKIVFMPRIRPAWSFGLVLVGLYVVSDFGAVAVLDCEVLTWELYKARGGRDAIMLAFGLVLVVIPLLYVVRLLHGQQTPERGRAERSSCARALTGAPLILTYALFFIMVGIGVIIPVVSLFSWMMSGLEHGFTFAPVLGPALDTIIFATVGAGIVVLAALAPAWITARSSGRKSTLLEGAVYLTSSVPGVLIAVGILQLILGLKREAPLTLGSASAWTLLEGVGLFLFIGYLMRFLSQGYAALKPSLLRIDLSQEEAATGLGATAWRRFRTVIMPAIAPGAAAAYTLIFLSIAKELPITLMLVPLNHSTLAYRVFDAQQEGSLPDVGLAGLVLLTIALTLQVGLNRWRRDE